MLFYSLSKWDQSGGFEFLIVFSHFTLGQIALVTLKLIHDLLWEKAASQMAKCWDSSPPHTSITKFVAQKCLKRAGVIVMSAITSQSRHDSLILGCSCRIDRCWGVRWRQHCKEHVWTELLTPFCMSMCAGMFNFKMKSRNCKAADRHFHHHACAFPGYDSVNACIVSCDRTILRLMSVMIIRS